eukprot:snap_masked-scaffold_8-processed-gene-10.21-mRNA-1 protein AED:1.00 eAED:1.00 QI:0/0/0/0/1/1/4/0/67
MYGDILEPKTLCKFYHKTLRLKFGIKVYYKYMYFFAFNINALFDIELMKYAKDVLLDTISITHVSLE